jgi:hypothetical protein
MTMTKEETGGGMKVRELELRVTKLMKNKKMMTHQF